MFREVADVLMFSDGKQHTINISGNELIVKGEIKVVNSEERVVLCTDRFKNEQFYLFGEISEYLKQKVIKDSPLSDSDFSLITPCALAYFPDCDRFYRAFKIIYIGQRLYYLAVTINGLIKAFDAEEHIPISKNKMEELYNEIKVSSYAGAMKKQMYKKILML